MKKSDFVDILLMFIDHNQPQYEGPLHGSFTVGSFYNGVFVAGSGGRQSLIHLYDGLFGDDVLHVCYDAVPTLNFLLAHGLPTPRYLVDLFLELRAATNGVIPPDGLDLERALYWLGAPVVKTHRLNHDVDKLNNMRTLLKRLRVLDNLDAALYRGRFRAHEAYIERRGIPVDVELNKRITENLPHIRQQIVRSVNQQFHVYEGPHLDEKRMRRLLSELRIPWPMNADKTLRLDYDTIGDMARWYPVLESIREAEWLLHQIKPDRLPIYGDGRNRTPLRNLSSTTGRLQPRTSESIAYQPRFMRRLIKPPPGLALAEIDVVAEEFGIGAALSGDTNMISAYRQHDPYLAFAHQCGAVPKDATKEEFPEIRSRYKQALLGIGYGMGPWTLARRLGIPMPYAREIIEKHHRLYADYWEWYEANVNQALFEGVLHTRQGWPIHITTAMNERSIGNWLLQAHGAEVLRLAIMLAHQRGIEICMPVHDSLLIEANIDAIEEAAAATVEAIGDASEQILGGFRLKAKVEQIVKYPDRYDPEIGEEQWQIIMDTIQTRPVVY